MKCPYCRWTGPFRSFGRHQWNKHKARVQRNLAKARKASRRKSRSSKGDAVVQKQKGRGKGSYVLRKGGATITITVR